MHFAYPPRKSSNPPPFRPRSTKLPIPPLLRRSRLKTAALVALCVIGLLFLIANVVGGGSSQSAPHQPSGHPAVVIVTVINRSTFSPDYYQHVKDNRIQYAKRHGYETFMPDITEYDLHGSPPSWSKVVALRHALSKFPDCRYLWYLDQDAFIMDPKVTLEGHLMDPKQLESLMIKDHPVVPPDSIIKTFSHLKGDEVDFVLTQDKEGLSSGSFVVRNGEWARFFLETWFGPLYRSYNFLKAESHALEHIVQWHPTILSKLALVPQRTINSYNYGVIGDRYEAGDMVVRFPGCAKTGELSCDKEADRFLAQWQSAFASA